ncbi:hypothetical protein D187_001839 [Cystobacter fuscus DSM 2262]|uniref:Uncharacterized protein n=1 Tax=Cystobacter fuscus (strain ATCC 25194 / DSM 2262 / NBRC 100088 / M29) TaxID=1242864 RepID=S9PDG7_CYSF2|nr:hypothetical protein [Cystobacter fuscus]EPX60352.1 hypothetical protein D187_001839 [Cystobacter fuscus DSM 2262]
MSDTTVEELREDLEAPLEQTRAEVSLEPLPVFDAAPPPDAPALAEPAFHITLSPRQPLHG